MDPLVPVRARLDELETLLREPVVITTAAQASDVTDQMLALASIKRGLEQARKETLAPVKARLDQMRADFDGLLLRVAEVETGMKDALLAWRQAQARAAQEAATQRAEVAGELAGAEAHADAVAAGLTVEQAEALRETIRRAAYERAAEDIAPADPPRATAGLAGSASATTRWTFTITDAAAVPRDYCAPDYVAIGRAVRASHGAIRIPGVQITAEERIVARRRPERS